MKPRKAVLMASRDTAIGDFWLKLPRIYTENIFIHFDGMKRDPLHKYVPRLQTPPYVSAKAEVYHRRIRGRTGSAAGPRDVFLITCTDAFSTRLCKGGRRSWRDTCECGHAPA